MSLYFCCDEQRRNRVRTHARLNGIDFVEVQDEASQPKADRQRTLWVHLLNENSAASLNADNVRIEGGEAVRGFRVTGFVQSGPVITIQLDQRGDFSTYTLRLVATPTSSAPPADFDPLLSAVDFSFKVNCPTDFDCQDEVECPPSPANEPDINYLAKDFNSFRQLMLDRLRLLAPAWQEQSLADLLHVLVDLKAYVADYQSYQQDANTTEAYLGTARRRISMRRHARLVDYNMHDGCNARTWLHVRLNAEVTPGTPFSLPAGVQVFTQTPGLPVRLAPGADSPEFRTALQSGAEFFETMHPATLYREHNELCFYTWGDDNCCLPQGATRATLKGDFANLRVGDVLVLEEVRGPKTGKAADADLNHRQAVRLVEVWPGKDPLTDPPTPVTEIRWDREDALTFPLCLSTPAPLDSDLESQCEPAISVARGNMVLVDHGRTLAVDEGLGAVPASQLAYAGAGDFCQETPSQAVPPRYRPRLQEGPVTQAAPYNRPIASLDYETRHEQELDAGRVPRRIANRLQELGAVADELVVVKQGDQWVIRDPLAVYVVRRELDPLTAEDELNLYAPPSARASLQIAPPGTLPVITLTSAEQAGATLIFQSWHPQRDLLNSSKDAPEFVVEVETPEVTQLRFGDDRFGKQPNTGAAFTARYRVGNGRQGNVGAEAIHHIVTLVDTIAAVRNPLPAQGGQEPESNETVRLNAPYAYRTQERAVTPQDYAEVARRHPEVHGQLVHRLSHR